MCLNWVCNSLKSEKSESVSYSIVSNCLQPHGSSVHGILQTRILEWVLSCVVLSHSVVSNSYLSGYPFPSPGVFLTQIEPSSALQAESLLSEPPRKPSLKSTFSILGSFPGLGRSPGEGNRYPPPPPIPRPRYSCMENSMDRGAWWPTVHGVTNSWTQLSNQHFHFALFTFYIGKHWHRNIILSLFLTLHLLSFIPGPTVSWSLISFFASLHSMQGHSSLTSDRTHAPALEGQSLNLWTAREVLFDFILYFAFASTFKRFRAYTWLSILPKYFASNILYIFEFFAYCLLSGTLQCNPQPGCSSM